MPALAHQPAIEQYGLVNGGSWEYAHVPWYYDGGMMALGYSGDYTLLERGPAEEVVVTIVTVVSIDNCLSSNGSRTHSMIA